MGEDKVRIVSEINSFTDLEEGGVNEFVSGGSIFTMNLRQGVEESVKGLN